MDAAFADEPSAWLADPEAEIPAQEVLRTKAPAAEPVVPEPSIGGSPASWPQDLDAFRQWWLSEPSLDEGGRTARLMVDLVASLMGRKVFDRPTRAK